MLTPFHVALPVRNIAEARRFYGDVLGCTEGRSDTDWVDFNLYGHQIVTHLAPDSAGVKAHNPVDKDDVPIPHFGVVLPMDQWNELAERLKVKGIEFIIEPKVRFKGEIGEQATMFFLDPSGNALEFKSFKDFSLVFAK